MQKRQGIFFAVCVLFLTLILTLAMREAPSPLTQAVSRPTDSIDNGGIGGQICLNTATAEELMTLPDLGPILAQRILDYRERHHGFDSLAELLQVEGVGEARFAKWRPYLYIGIWEGSS